MPKPIHEVDARFRLCGSLDPKSLPVLAADILKWSLGHSEVRILDGPGDGRRDILSRQPNGEQHLTQCKHHTDDSKSVASRETDEIVIALAKFDIKSATFLTNARISPQAKREYVDNFPQYSLDFIDGDLLLQFVEESPLLARMWMHGSTLGMTTHRLLIPFVVRNAGDDTVAAQQTDRDGDICNSCVLRKFSGGDFFLQDSVFEGPSFDDVNDLFVAVESSPFLRC
ncbi:restriction endonuclease [Roseiconus lacunae]|uniref:restriction endonuclease n=1 Tax=Roseiconus lacunae TaxID=2605694 RepID=UPI0036F1C201